MILDGYLCIELTTVTNQSTAGDMTRVQVNAREDQVWRGQAGFFWSVWFLSPTDASVWQCDHVLLSAFSDEIQPMMPLHDKFIRYHLDTPSPDSLKHNAKMKLPPSPPVDAVK